MVLDRHTRRLRPPPKTAVGVHHAHLSYDRAADILYITRRPPYKAQESEEFGDEVIARLNPKTREVEGLEILFFSTGLLDGNWRRAILRSAERTFSSTSP